MLQKKASDWPRGRHSFALKLGEPIRMSPFPFHQSEVKLHIIIKLPVDPKLNIVKTGTSWISKYINLIYEHQPNQVHI